MCVMILEVILHLREVELGEWGGLGKAAVSGADSGPASCCFCRGHTLSLPGFPERNTPTFLRDDPRKAPGHGVGQSKHRTMGSISS